MNALSVGWSLATPPSVRPTRYLHLVTRRRSQAARAPFVAVVVGLLLSGLLGLLVLNTVLAQDAFRLHQLQVDARALADREQALARQVSDLQSPHSLAARATSLGMVPGGSPAFLRLSDGKVLGRSEPAVATALIAPAAPAAAPSRTSTSSTSPQQRPAPKKAAPADGGWAVVTPAAKGGRG